MEQQIFISSNDSNYDLDKNVYLLSPFVVSGGDNNDDDNDDDDNSPPESNGFVPGPKSPKPGSNNDSPGSPCRADLPLS